MNISPEAGIAILYAIVAWPVGAIATLVNVVMIVSLSTTKSSASQKSAVLQIGWLTSYICLAVLTFTPAVSRILPADAMIIMALGIPVLPIIHFFYLLHRHKEIKSESVDL